MTVIGVGILLARAEKGLHHGYRISVQMTYLQYYTVASRGIYYRTVEAASATGKEVQQRVTEIGLSISGSICHSSHTLRHSPSMIPYGNKVSPLAELTDQSITVGVELSPVSFLVTDVRSQPERDANQTVEMHREMPPYLSLDLPEIGLSRQSHFKGD